MYEEVMKPGDILYHGTKKKISFCELGGTCDTEPYGFTTDKFEYAKLYAGKTGKVLSWTPKREIRILILSRESLENVIDWIKDKYGENDIDIKVAKRIFSKHFASRSVKIMNTEKHFKKALKENPDMYTRIKKLKPYEFFSVGERFDFDKAKKLLNVPIDEHNNVFLPGGLRAIEFNCDFVNTKKTIPKEVRERMKKERISCGPISLTKKGYFRYSLMQFDVGLYHYLFNYLKYMKYDGVKLITNGFVDDVNLKKNVYENVEFVINSKLLKKVENKKQPNSPVKKPKTKPNSPAKKPDSPNLTLLQLKRKIDEICGKPKRGKPTLPCSSAITALKQTCKEYTNHVYEKRNCRMKKKAGRKPRIF